MFCCQVTKVPKKEASVDINLSSDIWSGIKLPAIWVVVSKNMKNYIRDIEKVNVILN